MSAEQKGSYSSIERQLLEQGVYVSTTVGTSMKPMLRNRRDRIVVLPVGDKRLGKWDLPMYRRPDGKYVLHRIIGVAEDHYIIRGDNTYVKEYVPFDWVLGYVSEFYRGKKHISTEQKGYRLYAALWHRIYCVRFLVRGVLGGMRWVKRKLLKCSKKEKAMEPKDYIVTRIEGEYAYLRELGGSGENELFIALALLPPETDVGVCLHYEMPEYRIVEKGERT